MTTPINLTTKRYKIQFYRRLTGERGDTKDTGLTMQTDNLTEPEAQTVKDILEQKLGALTDFAIVEDTNA